MSRGIKFTKAEGPEVFEFVETQVPAPGPHEIRIKEGNRSQPCRIHGEEKEAHRGREVSDGSGYEAVGIVDAAEKQVTGVAVADLVSTLPAFSQNDYST